jgi:hypothetical protein
LRYVRSHFGDARVALDRTEERIIDPTWSFDSSIPGQLTMWPLDDNTVPLTRTLCIMVRDAWSTHEDVPSDWKVSITSSSRGLVEFGAAAATKVAALRWFCGRHGIDLADVLAFGDMPNDLDMLGAAGHSVAVANADDNVKAQVGFITASNNDDGVARFLEAFVLGRDPTDGRTLQLM